MKSVLLLEDDEGLRFTFAMALKDMGYNVISAANCDDAIDAISDTAPNVIILDLKIGSGTSLNVADYAEMKYPNTPVVYVTGSGMFPRGELFSYNDNTRWVLRKPVNLIDLVSMVDHVAETPRAASNLP